MKTKNLLIFVFSLTLSLFSLNVKAQTTLTPGQIAITGFNFDDPDQFSFVLLTDITNTTAINFTDNGWLSSGSFRSGEGICAWSATSDMTCGTEITITGTTASHGNVSSNTMNFSGSGDQILAYQGTFGSPTHIYGLNSEGTGWQASATSSNTSGLPTGLTDGTNAVALNEIDNATYDCSTLTDQTALLAAISNPANWSGSSTTRQTVGPGCAYSCGTVSCTATEPTSNASAYVFSAITCNSITLDWTRPGGGSNDGCIVVVRAGSDVTTDPVDGTSYTASATLGSGTDIGTNEFVVFDGTGTSVTVTGLAASTTYYFNVFEYNDDGVATCIDYRTSDEVSGNSTTIVCPTPPLPSSQGMLINEFSNGPAGTEEYYEFVVAGNCGDLVDVSGYILDDNNGTFTVGFPDGSGIARGHLRLTNNAQWTSIPVGSVIVIYNANERNSSIPTDDPTDSDNDSLYIIPHDNSTLFEYEATIPFYLGTSNWDSTYAPATYIAPPTATGWGGLGLRNGGDAVQVRDPNGNYWHGVSYGGSEISGGPDNMKISTANLGGSVGYFNSGDFLDASNWSTGTVPADETPGAANNAANLAWLRLMRDPLAPTCPVVLPVELLNFDGERINENLNLLHWSTSSEKNNAGFEVLKSNDGIEYETIGFVAGAGNSSMQLNYSFNDYQPFAGENYYKLRQIDYDGQVKNYNPIVLDNSSKGLEIKHWNVNNGDLVLSLKGYTDFKAMRVELTDILGNLLLKDEIMPNNSIQLAVGDISAGIYLVTIFQGDQMISKKVKF